MIFNVFIHTFTLTLPDLICAVTCSWNYINSYHKLKRNEKKLHLMYSAHEKKCKQGVRDNIKYKIQNVTQGDTSHEKSMN